MGGRDIFKVLMVKTVKHHHRRRVRYPTRLFGTAGYVGLASSWLLVLGAAGSIGLDTLLLRLPRAEQTEVESTVTNYYYGSEVVTSTTTPDPSIFIQLFLILLFVSVVALLSHFVAERSSRLLRHLLSGIGLKVTLGVLLVAKSVSALLAVLVQLVVVLGLPEGTEQVKYLLVIVTGLIAVAAVVSFAVQHAIARRAKMLVKNVL